MATAGRTTKLAGDLTVSAIGFGATAGLVRAGKVRHLGLSEPRYRAEAPGVACPLDSS
jgi:aryl-alcohol dehydrogenase-like predicted oxidoreductase